MAVNSLILTPSAMGDTAPCAANTDRLRVRHLSLEEWQQFVEEHPDSTVFHHRRWIEMLSSQYGGRIVIPAAFRGEQLLTAIPFLETKSFLQGHKLVSLPFSDCVPLLWSSDAALKPPLASDGAGDLQTAALGALQADLQSAGHRHFHSIVIRSIAPLAGAPSESRYYRHAIDTNRPYEAIQAGFNHAARRNLKTAVAKGLTFEIGRDAQAMDWFYRLHVLTRQRLGVPVQPKSFFRRMQQRIIDEGLGFVGLVMHGSRPAAAGVFLTYKRSMIYKYGASCPSLLELRPNELLFASALRWAATNNFHDFDLGVSNKEHEGLCAFKRKLGAVQTEAHRVFLAGAPRPTMQQWRTRRLVAWLIQRSPTFVCRGIGKLLYGYSQ